jgi:hypothetical protein
MLHDPSRHEALDQQGWDEGAARAAIARIVADAEHAYTAERWWPAHPRDVEPGEDAQALNPSLYYGACGVMWALHHLQDLGAANLARSYRDQAQRLLDQTPAFMGAQFAAERASYMMGETPIRLWASAWQRDAESQAALHTLLRGNLNHPARELMWGSPGSLLAASFVHESTGDAMWADLYRETAAQLWSQLLWSDEFACHYWMQDLYGTQSTYLDAVHGFVATAHCVLRGLHLLAEDEQVRWLACIANTVQKTATWEGGQVNWRARLTPAPTKPLLMQFCHGSPGFVICLGNFPGVALDATLLAAGEATWAAGPLNKGSNLCHGTGGNGYAFLKLWQRTGNELWLQRARAFAMHGITQTEADRAHYGQGRYSLWTGDVGFAIYLWHCIQGSAAFPTLDVYFSAPPLVPSQAR